MDHSLSFLHIHAPSGSASRSSAVTVLVEYRSRLRSCSFWKPEALLSDRRSGMSVYSDRLPTWRVRSSRLLPLHIHNPGRAA